MNQRRRYAQVGLGGRAAMYTWAIADMMKEHSELVGLCDVNRCRMELCNRKLAKSYGWPPVPMYPATQFDRMVREQRPEVVIVTPPDCFHDRYIVRAMELGCDVITEKPMTIDARRCQRILDAVRRTKRNLRVTFNYRYSPPRLQVKELLAGGIIGRVLSVEFQWLLDTSHGADYYRRWHREKRNSGGLLVHKATHHFDLVNWWLEARPVEVFARGRRCFYGRSSGMAGEYGLRGHAERCHRCRHLRTCRFALDLAAVPDLKAMYLDCEGDDGYFRDRCVFGKPMDIEDAMSVVVQYDTGAILSYSLNSFTPWEGYRIAFNGTRGRLEHQCMETVYVSGDGRVPATTIPSGTHIRVYPHFESSRDIPIRAAEGGHGGGDLPLLRSLFLPDPPPDPYHCAAGVMDGAMSILTGIAANQSIKTGRPVKVACLVNV